MTNAELDFMTEIRELIGDKKFHRMNRLIAKQMEKSYRRGAQQALVMGNRGNIMPKILKDNMTNWRFKTPLTKSVGLDGYTTTSEWRAGAEGWFSK